MKNVKKLIATALIGIFVVSAVGCKMVGKTEASIKKSTVATVNKEKITRGELDKKMEGVTAQMKQNGIDPNSEQGKEVFKQQRSKVLESLIMEKIVMQKAAELKVVPEKAKLTEEVNKKLEELKGQFKDEQGKFDETKFNEALKQGKFTIDDVKKMLESQIINEKVQEYIVKDVKVDDAAVKQEYDMYGNTKYTEKPNTIHVAHILSKTEDEAKKVKERLTKGEDFAKVAKEVSTEEAAKQSGGDLGEINFDGSTAGGQQMDATFMKGAIALSKGAISNPIKTDFGFHIIKCIDKKEYPAQKFDAVKEQIKNNLLDAAKQKKLQETVEKWKKDAKTETKKYEKNLDL